MEENLAEQPNFDDTEGIDPTEFNVPDIHRIVPGKIYLRINSGQQERLY